MTPVRWFELEPPRQPVAVLADGRAAAALAERVAERVRRGASLRAAASDDVLLVMGDADDLPWSAGITYLGRSDGLLLPTTLAPEVPADLLAQAVRQAMEAGRPETQIAVVPGRVVAFDLGVRAVDPDWIVSWAAGGAA